MLNNCCNRNKFFALNMMELIAPPVTCEYDIDACAYFEAVVLNGGADLQDATKIYWNNIIIQMKMSGSFQKFDRLFAFSNEHEIAARTSLVNPGIAMMASPINAPTFTPWVGYDTDGATNFITTNFDLNSGTNYLQDDCFFGWGSTNIVGGGLSTNGCASGITFTAIYPDFGGSLYSACNNNAGFELSAVQSPLDGDYIVKRNNAANYDLYKDSTLIGNISHASSIQSGLIPAMGCRNENNGTSQIAFIQQTGKWEGVGSSSINVAQFRLDFTSQLL